MEATLRLLERSRWSELTLAAVGRAAKLSWSDVFDLAPSKSALVNVVLRRIAEETARAYRPDRASQSVRERLFDVCMTWFDAQQKKKRALRALYSGLRGDPLTLLSARGPILETAERMLALAEADAGMLAPARSACIAGILARATVAWLEDDKDMSRTMAQVDRDLRRVEGLFALTEKPRQRKRRKSPPG